MKRNKTIFISIRPTICLYVQIPDMITNFLNCPLKSNNTLNYSSAMWCKARQVQLFYQTHIPSFLSILTILVATSEYNLLLY